MLNKYFLKEIDINEKIHTFLKIHFALKELRNNSSHGGTLNLENKFGSEQLKIWIDKYMKAINDLDNGPYINVIRNNELFIFSGFLNLGFLSSNIFTTLILAPPCLGPLRDPSAAAIAEYVSVPEDDTRCVVNVELLPPPCSI